MAMQKSSVSGLNSGHVGRQPVAQLLVVVALLLLGVHVSTGEANCVVKNQSSQPVVLVPVAQAVVEVVVAVGASVVLETAQQTCYVVNKHTGHKKGPVKLASGGIYAIVDATIAGQVNVCIATLLGSILNIGAVIIAGI